MKKMTLLKSIATVALFSVVGMGAFAQVIPTLPALKVITAPSDTSSKADTVSIGAIMPYYVNPDAIIEKATTLYNPSGFLWNFNGGGVTGLTNSGGTALTASPVGAGFYSDSLVLATMPGTVGSITMNVTERSNPKFSATSGCAGGMRTLGIEVIKLPVVPVLAPADATQGGCSASATYTVKFDFSASTVKFPVYVSYTISAFDVNNNPVGTPVNRIYQITDASKYIVVDKTSDLDVVSTSGVKYTVKLGQEWDRISSNATNRNSLAVDASALSADILILPTPKTGIIKHIKTL